jgi:hypothetical protein
MHHIFINLLIVMAFTRNEVETLKRSLKEFVRNMKKIGIHPQVRVDQKSLFILIDLDEIVSIVRNRVMGCISPTSQRFVRVNVKRDGNIMTVEVYKLE